jgi:MoaA/NifB/PqqE/SkfB family radical SAM enzyme
MRIPPLYHTFQRYRTLMTDRITALPIAILMPHSACNCRCVMCDIWKGNHNLRQLTQEDIEGLLTSLKKLGTRQVVMSGGEALLNPAFFSLCAIFRQEGMKITLLSTGLSLNRHAAHILKWVDELIVSLDGDEKLHDSIRNVPGAFHKLKEGVGLLHSLNPDFRITARTVIHRLNFRRWPAIVASAAAMGLQQVSFLPADVSSQAFNRAEPWDETRQLEILPEKNELPLLRQILRQIIADNPACFETKFIAESPAKLEKIGDYYEACYGLRPFPYKKCNAPWVSAVVEADGTVRPCFFHQSLGNIREAALSDIVNSAAAIHFRKTLDMDKDDTCRKCVCYLNLAPAAGL